MTDNVTEFRVRYGECDMQGVVFNANYLVYVDDAVDRWIRRSLSRVLGRDPEVTLNLHDIDFDFMVKAVSLTFDRAVTYGETLQLRMSVGRWGNSSFDVDVRGSVGDESRFNARVTYVSVRPAVNTPVEIPAVVREALG